MEKTGDEQTLRGAQSSPGGAIYLFYFFLIKKMFLCVQENGLIRVTLQGDNRIFEVVCERIRDVGSQF